MREIGHSDKSVNSRCTHPLEQGHLAASEQTASLVRKAGKHVRPVRHRACALSSGTRQAAATRELRA